MAVTRKRKPKIVASAVPLTSADLARLAARVADDKKAEDVVIMDLTGFPYVTDYFVIASSSNPRQMAAISHAIQHEMALHGRRAVGVQGADDAHWVLVDCSDFVVHIFDPDWRKLYDLELLWGDVPRLAWAEPKRKRGASSEKTSE